MKRHEFRPGGPGHTSTCIWGDPEVVGSVCYRPIDDLLHRSPEELSVLEDQAAKELESLGYEEVIDDEPDEYPAITALFGAKDEKGQPIRSSSGFMTFVSKGDSQVQVWPVTVGPFEDSKPKQIQLVVVFADGDIGYFPVPNDQGWKIRRGEIVVGKGLGRTHIPIGGIKHYSIQEY